MSANWKLMILMWILIAEKWLQLNFYTGHVVQCTVCTCIIL